MACVFDDNLLLRCELLAEYGADDAGRRLAEVALIGDFVGEPECVEDIEGETGSSIAGGARFCWIFVGICAVGNKY